MAGVIVLKPNDLKWEPFEEHEGCRIARVLDAGEESAISGYVSELNDGSVSWETKCDSIILGLKGCLRITVDDTTCELGRGDVFWAPGGSVLNCESESSKAFVTLYPAHCESNASALAADLPHKSDRALLIRRNDLTLESVTPDADGDCEMGVYVGGDISGTVGCSLSYFDRCSLPWTVHYDEFMVVLEGTYRMSADGEVYEVEKGGIVFLPKGTELVYEGDKALVFASIYPVDWRRRIEKYG